MGGWTRTNDLRPGTALLVPHGKRRNRRSQSDMQKITKFWWRRLDSNQRPTDYETVALTT